ncbi:YebC/PmpR family DNA-binding transcriptional regulator [Patescibacteria group bacterium]|nr:YebC/PmpR family DNA-binding transcriptional regulator [Patescibacteria group bacterium]
MSGHSKWSTIKHKKEATDAARGKLFSKLSRAISIAVKTGGGSDPISNSKLKVSIDAAKSANMPKVNIERAISRGSGGGQLEEVTYEGFGPSGIGVIVETATDNRNRTGQEIKGLFERGGGHLAGPGAVSFNFEAKGLLLVSKNKNTEDQILKLIDLGAEDVEETKYGIEVYIIPNKLSEVKKRIIDEGFSVSSTEFYKKPKSLQTVTEKEAASKVLAFLTNLENHDDVQKVFTNIDVPDEILESIKK